MIESTPNILVIKSAKSELHKVQKFISDVFASHQLNKECFNKVFLCISEATINSIVHGNKGDYNKKVELWVDCKTHLISVSITDEGDGFDVDNLPNPTKKENLLKESGRGIHIIKTIAKHISFNEKGNRLQFDIECK
ncbi:ATP-binding protein [Prolixibacteraceae bacterium Z1-6]|uniref:ATP-binding protein n=1 Tax=Draconibacterium aestuarii TaxID=2998507 RepID=A0A9X3FFP9_9BACT|nr:ATP-binding protein [Prolixibacteraceae bacterium Z1-6]